MRQTRALSERGVEQEVLTLPMPGGPAEARLGERVIVRGVQGYAPAPPGRSPGAIGQAISWILGVRRELNKRPPHCDLIHVHAACAPWPLLCALQVRRALRVPLVITIHCSITATYRSASGRDAAFQHVARRVERRAIRVADHTITLTERVRDRIVGAGWTSADRASVIRDCVDVAAFARAGDADAGARFAARHGLPRQRPIVAYVGRVAREKGWPALLELAVRMPEAHLLVCGGGEDEAALRQAVATRGLGDRFTLTGFIEPGGVPAAMACATVLVVPSTFEEFGSVVAEAMAVGVPAVGFDVGGVAEAIENEKTGLVVPAGDVAGLTAAVQRLVQDTALRREMSDYARARAAEAFDVGSAAERLLAVYRSASGRL